MQPEDILILSILGGIIPAIFWLKFWLKKETHLEPRGLILGTFLLGMCSVLLAIPLEQLINVYFEDYWYESILYFENYEYIVVFLMVVVEELVKFLAAYGVALKSRFVDEPIDPTIYLITAALGFAAFENILYLIMTLTHGSLGDGIATLNSRFVGATILHIISTGSIGLFIGMAFYKSKKTKFFAVLVGFAIAVLLHTAFNTFIIHTDGEKIITIYSAVWIGLIALIVILEKIKKIKRIS